MKSRLIDDMSRMGISIPERFKKHTIYDKKYLSSSLKIDEEDYDSTTTLSAVVDVSRDNTLESIGKILHNIHTLSLDNSNISAVSHIGASFLNLRVLSINHCNVSSVSQLHVYRYLERADVSYNLLDSLPADVCPSLQYFNAEGNFYTLENLSNISSVMPRLTTLCIESNPLSYEDDHVSQIARLHPRISVVNDQEVDKPQEGEAMRDPKEKRKDGRGAFNERAKKEMEKLYKDEMILYEYKNNKMIDIDEIDRMLYEIDNNAIMNDNTDTGPKASSKNHKPTPYGSNTNNNIRIRTNSSNNANVNSRKRHQSTYVSKYKL